MSMKAWWARIVAGAIVAFAASACAGGPVAPGHPAAPASTQPAPSPSAAPTVPPVGETPSAVPAPAFHGSVARIDDATQTSMVSWHPGCPVPLSDLRLLTLDYWGFDGEVHTGRLIVHRTVAADVVSVFAVLFDAGFPIRRMELVDRYGGDDARSMAADNTSGFNCRTMPGGTGWSEHAYGRAIDINPVENPYVTGGGAIEPSAGAAFLDRSRQARGMIHARDVVARAFGSVGWVWGGTWSDPVDYQHFSSTGH